MKKEKIFKRPNKQKLITLGIICAFIILLSIIRGSISEIITAVARLVLELLVIFCIVVGLANFFRKKLLDKKKNENPFF